LWVEEIKKKVKENRSLQRGQKGQKSEGRKQRLGVERGRRAGRQKDVDCKRDTYRRRKACRKVQKNAKRKDKEGKE